MNVPEPHASAAEDVRPPKAPRRYTRGLILLVLASLALLSLLSYRAEGIVYVLVTSIRGGGASMDDVRAWVLGWGTLAPIAYVLIVIVEVIVAPIPGTLLYAPAGAIWGGAWGGTLSLIGNVLGATIAGAIARTFGTRITERLDASRVAALAERVRRRGVFVIALLRLNPLTSSDLVSYAAGLVRVPLWQITLGTLLGMAPACYLQAYLAEELFAWLPGSGLILLVLAAVYVVVVVALLLGK